MSNSYITQNSSNVFHSGDLSDESGIFYHKIIFTDNAYKAQDVIHLEFGKDKVDRIIPHREAIYNCQKSEGDCEGKKGQ